MKLQPLLQVISDILKVEASELTLNPLQSHGNNAIFDLRTPSGHFLVKQYFRDPSDRRNRGKTEFLFSTFLWKNGIRDIPEPIGYNDDVGVGAFQFLDGNSLTPQTVSKEDVKALFSFITKINGFRGLKEAKALPAASEACFTLNAHLETVEKRLGALKDINISNDIDAEAKSFVISELTPFWNRYKETEINRISQHSGSGELTEKERCISPSDFGFHNAIRWNHNLYLYDFEYAGWDDPAKLICDFYNQPRVPAPIETLEGSIKQISEGLSLNYEELRARVSYLFPVYGIKWCCILLNEFLPAGSKRRVHSGIVDLEKRKSEQLNKAQKALTSVGTQRLKLN